MDSQVLQTQVGDPPDLNDKYFRSLSSAPQAILCVACEGSNYQYRVLPFECFIASWVLRSTGREQSHPRAEYLFFSVEKDSSLQMESVFAWCYVEVKKGP